MEVGTPPCPALASSLQADLQGHPCPDTKKGLVQSLQGQRGAWLPTHSVAPWACLLTVLSLSFLVCKMGELVLSIWNAGKFR